MNVIKKICFSLLVSVGLFGCAFEPSRTAEETVADRAQERWSLVVERDFAAAWEYLTPGLRAQGSEAAYIVDRSRSPVVWDAAEVQEADCVENRCDVSVKVRYTARGAPGVLAGFENERTVRETWIRIDGQWWYSPDA